MFEIPIRADAENRQLTHLTAQTCDPLTIMGGPKKQERTKKRNRKNKGCASVRYVRNEAGMAGIFRRETGIAEGR